ncbi:hypothetical protein ES319_D08G199800v1 [Gossypium barbadense]|uniref:Expansin-like B1 n=2 Tax=Gossypium TaxID=3633 RepID=A0A5J5QFZ2_GOSBA|nr:hypothetical protein ES319_D08G199800v1 [Gossypium barbadense]TYH59205.1 hypothetical protein ES332_D08G207600v1 [Gossypium tomentosum]
MGFSLKLQYYCLVCVMVLLPALCYSKDYFVKTRATYYGSSDGLGTTSGACGFGEYGRNISSGNVAGVYRLYKNGVGCGACYQVRCTTNPQICTKKGVNVVVTDYGQGDNTDFILSHHAYEAMARPGTADRLLAYGVVDVEYQRVPCQYVGHKIQVKVHEYSRKPDYLAIIMLYQAGKSDILSVDIWQQGKWVEMRRSFGAVFDMTNPPLGAISLRFKVQDNAGIKWPKAVIPRNWKAGVAYDTDIQLQ